MRNIGGTTIWFAGRPCSGKTTLADNLKQVLLTNSYSLVKRLDGDELRAGLCEDLNFTPEDIEENLRRAAYLAKSFNMENIPVLASFVTPTQNSINLVRKIITSEKFRLIYINAPLEECEKRDVKGMYALAREGQIKNFIGIDSPYEPPQSPDLVLNTDKENIYESMGKILGAFFT
jgi:adenylylsulfate kinase